MLFAPASSTVTVAAPVVASHAMSTFTSTDTGSLPVKSPRPLHLVRSGSSCLPSSTTVPVALNVVEAVPFVTASSAASTSHETSPLKSPWTSV